QSSGPRHGQSCDASRARQGPCVRGVADIPFAGDIPTRHRIDPSRSGALIEVSSERTRRGIRVVRAGLLINSLLVVVKIGAGVIGHSYALIADGVESTLDIFSSLIVWRGIRIASRSADEAYHYGYGKAESVAAAAV